jgi:anthranilate/para-aminobenzoate synthase component I
LIHFLPLQNYIWPIPAPEAFVLQTEEFSLVSCSPEIVIEKKGRHIKTRPIGGTYERNQSENDRSVIERFLNDPKEVAEHNMLVDLGTK